MSDFRTQLRQAALMHLVKLARQSIQPSQVPVNERTWNDLLLESIPAAGAGGAAGYFSRGIHKNVAELGEKLIDLYDAAKMKQINRLTLRIAHRNNPDQAKELGNKLKDALTKRVLRWMQRMDVVKNSPYARYGISGALGLGAGLGTLGLLQFARSQFPRPFGTLTMPPRRLAGGENS